MKEFCRVEDVAALLSVTPNAVRGMIRKGRIPALKLGRRYYIRREALVALFRESESDRVPSRRREIARVTQLLPPPKRRTSSRRRWIPEP